MINLNNKSFLKFFLFFLISGILIFFDQLTKFFAVKYIKTDLLTISFKPFFEFLYVENTGAAFGIFKGMRVFFILITIVAIIVLLFYVYKINLQKEKNFFIFLILIFSGAIGNFIDRVRLSYVVDFINFCFIDFPVFNLADTYITVAIFLLILCFLFEKKVNATKS